ncbi:MAG TPA: hypothetical protein VGT08_07235 [Terracidiphilus sp.]|nr:hypothetical protein [Terracidiphilus sp.]
MIVRRKWVILCKTVDVGCAHVRFIGGTPIATCDFCWKRNIEADVEVSPIRNVNEAYDRLLKKDLKYLFSIHIA